MTAGTHYQIESAQVHRYHHRRKTRRNRDCRASLSRELELIPLLPYRGPSHNPRYPRVSASRQPRPFSNPKHPEPLPPRALLRLPPRPPPPPAFSAMEGRAVQMPAPLRKKRRCPHAFRAHRGRYRQSRGGLRRIISSMWKVTKRVLRRTRTLNDRHSKCCTMSGPDCSRVMHIYAPLVFCHHSC